ncbi:MAG: hypothetical protein O7E50_08825 [Gemmatimonadetes bacterium]|nr:hypothetical protein [Gemmatimonadota bacterium]
MTIRRLETIPRSLVPPIVAIGALLFQLIAAGEAGAQGRERAPPEVTARLQYVGTVRQLGPVAYRDPLGVISPDGVWLAFAAGRRLGLQRIEGGPIRDLARAEGQFTDLQWLPDSRHVAARERSFNRGESRWLVFDIQTGERRPLWPEGMKLQTRGGRTTLRVPGQPDGITFVDRPFSIKVEELDELTWSSSGRVAGIAHKGESSHVWLFDPDGSHAVVREIDQRFRFPAFRGGGGDIACLSKEDRDLHPQMEFSCGGAATGGFSPVAYGPFAFSDDGRRLYYAAPNELGTLDLWVRGVPGSGANPRQDQLTRFTRDTYAPSVSRNGRILFKTQDYRAHIAMVPAPGGTSRAVTTFQSEIPSWDWSGSRIGFTFGSWRRVLDDLNYPDIAQHLGYITLDGSLPEDKPGRVVRASQSEDQGMHWSPNGKWIVLHSHAEGSDDIWLQPADGSEKAHRISGDGHETGWPRWSPDGSWIVFPSFVERDNARQGVLYVIGVDQESGEVTVSQREIPLGGLVGAVAIAEWSPDSRELAFEWDDGSGTKAIYVVALDGGSPRKIHEYRSDQLFSGISVSPDFQWVAYIAPAPDGHLQVFRVPMSGGEPQQVTSDPTDKAHPAYSPNGEWIAFTIFSYKSIFWVLIP